MNIAVITILGTLGLIALIVFCSYFYNKKVRQNKLLNKQLNNPDVFGSHFYLFDENRADDRIESEKNNYGN